MFTALSKANWVIFYIKINISNFFIFYFLYNKFISELFSFYK